MKGSTSVARKDTKRSVTLKEVLSRENVLRALRESTEDQRKVIGK